MKPHKFYFVGLKCQKCRDLRAFFGVNSGLLILVRVKDLTFSKSAEEEDAPDLHSVSVRLLMEDDPSC